MSSESWTRQQDLHPLEFLPQLVTGISPSVRLPSVFALCQEKKNYQMKKSSQGFPLQVLLYHPCITPIPLIFLKIYPIPTNARHIRLFLRELSQEVKALRQFQKQPKKQIPILSKSFSYFCSLHSLNYISNVTFRNVCNPCNNNKFLFFFKAVFL